MYDEMYIEAHLADLRRQFDAQKLAARWRAIVARDRAFLARIPARSEWAAPHQSIRAETLRAED